MKKLFFNQEIDFSLPLIEMNFENLGDVTITTSIYNGVIRAKFKRYTPEKSVEFTIQENDNNVRLQYMMFDALTIGKTISVNSSKDSIKKEKPNGSLSNQDVFEIVQELDDLIKVEKEVQHGAVLLSSDFIRSFSRETAYMKAKNLILSKI